MENTNCIFPSEAGTASEPIDLTMDAFCPVEPPLRPRMNSGPAPKEDTMAQELAGMKRRMVWSFVFLIPLFYISMGHMMGAPLPAFLVGHENAVAFGLPQLLLTLPVDADGVRILLDGRNVVVYLDTEHPTVYWDGLCDVTFTA